MSIEVAASSNELIQGNWKHFKTTFQGEETSKTYRTILYLDFQDTQSRLFWKNIDEEGYCERRGVFSYDPPVLQDTVMWVNPKNKIECGQDPDMKLGRTTQTRLEKNGNHLLMYLSIGEDFLIYYFEPRLDEASQSHPTKKDIFDF